MKLFLNSLIEWHLEAEAQAHLFERVLWLDHSEMVTIALENKRALPTWRKTEDLASALTTGRLSLLDHDPFAALSSTEQALPLSYRQMRDKAWASIQPLVESGSLELFDPLRRAQLIKAQAQLCQCHPKTIYRYLRRYWQGGQTKNALLPHYDRCGAPGVERSSTKTETKRGRPYAAQPLELAEHFPGINVDEAIKHKFRRGIKLFFENQAKRPLRLAYQLTLEKFFQQGYELKAGSLIPVLPPARELPTFAQFRYWYQKERDLSQALSARQGERRFNTHYRAVLGNSTQMAFGPGSIYQIDATIGDLYLISSLDPNRVIGRPVIYFIIDVFSRMITGFSVSLEGPSWLGAMLALENASCDKVALCQLYGITIGPEEWPSQHLPQTILADRGEMEGYNADQLVNGLGITVSNTAPYRADWKGIVERNFRLSNDQLIHWLPGAVYQPPERGGPDYRLEASLSLHQFRKLVIYSILHHNNEHRMAWYKLDEFMITDQLEPYPLELWNWGLQHRVGHLRRLPQDIVRLNLLPHQEASVTYQGILFQGLRYSCELALKEQWFVRARQKGRWKIEVAYDPRLLDQIYLPLEGGRRLEVCRLLESEKTYQGHDWPEVLDLLALQRQTQLASCTRQQQAQATFHAQMEAVIREASEVAQEQRVDLSNHARLSHIRDNRQDERRQERAAQAWQLGEAACALSSPPPVLGETGTGAAFREPEPSTDLDQTSLPLHSKVENEYGHGHGYVGPVQPLEKLRRLREERLKNGS